MIILDDVYTLFDDASVRKKLTVMTKWDAIFDDSRNPDTPIAEKIEEILQLGGKYRIKIEIFPCN